MSPKRVKLSESAITQPRTDYAITEDTEPTPPTPRRRPKPAPEQGAQTDKRVSFWLPRALFDAARSAYLVDVDALDNPPDTVARWVAAAIDRHARRSPRSRAQAAGRLPEVDQADSGPRSFLLPAATLAAMDEAIRDDRKDLHRLHSRTGFAAEAILTAAEAARERAGGELPPAPHRLAPTPYRAPGQ